MTTQILTVGHSNHTIDEFISLIKRSGVKAIADVRSSPYSQFSPQFNKNSLKYALQQADIAYAFLGEELGARSNDDCCYVNDVVSYSQLAKTELFRRGIDRLIMGSEKFQIAAMCSEKEPTECHRTILIARVLSNQGVKVGHILADGSVEPHEETELRLLDIWSLPMYDLMTDTKGFIEIAYSKCEEKIAYRRKRSL